MGQSVKRGNIEEGECVSNGRVLCRVWAPRGGGRRAAPPAAREEHRSTGRCCCCSLIAGSGLFWVLSNCWALAAVPFLLVGCWSNERPPPAARLLQQIALAESKQKHQECASSHAQLARMASGAAGCAGAVFSPLLPPCPLAASSASQQPTAKKGHNNCTAAVAAGCCCVPCLGATFSTFAAERQQLLALGLWRGGLDLWCSPPSSCLPAKTELNRQTVLLQLL